MHRTLVLSLFLATTACALRTIPTAPPVSTFEELGLVQVVYFNRCNDDEVDFLFDVNTGEPPTLTGEKIVPDTTPGVTGFIPKGVYRVKAEYTDRPACKVRIKQYPGEDIVVESATVYRTLDVYLDVGIVYSFTFILDDKESHDAALDLRMMTHGRNFVLSGDRGFNIVPINEP